MSVYATKSEFVYNHVRDAVLSGDLAPGERLNQVQLAARLGASTTPLREALRRLHAEGLVHLDAHRDARVTRLSAAEARHLTEIRLSLDPLAAGLAAKHHTPADAEELRGLLDQLGPIVEDTDDKVLVSHRRFHSVLHRASGNPLLAQLLDGLWDRTERYRRLGLELLAGTGRRRDMDFHEHFELVEHVLDGRVEAATALMHHHVAASLSILALDMLESEQSRTESAAGTTPTKISPTAAPRPDQNNRRTR